MKIFLVGGAVRDEVLSIPIKDRDWVVVGSSPEEMLKDGFIQVGADFPVFLHPESMEEYALARTERKTGPGYSGFVCSTDSQVTLEEDLFRRDLTINAMARSPAGKVIDPTGGLKDLAARVFRHVGPAFREDPVRILRVARMCARHPDFVIAPETMALMTDMVKAGEVNALVSERVWKELSRGLMEQTPSRMLNALRDCGALEVLLPELNRLWGVPQPLQWHPENCTGVHVGMVIDHAASIGAGLATRYACLLHDLGKGTTPPDLWPKHHCHEIRSAALAAVVSRRLGVPVECKSLAEVVAREHSNVHSCLRTKAAGVFRLLVRCDALRQPLRFEQLMIACECDARGRLGLEARLYPQSEMLRAALVVLQSVDVKSMSASCLARGLQGEAIGASISAARMRALSKWMRETKIQEVKDTKEASPATGPKRLAP